MTQEKTLVVTRHAPKDSGLRKDVLSEEGRKLANEYKIPEGVENIVRIGGTVLARTYTTAALIADGNNLAKAKFRASDPGFGSMDELMYQGFDYPKFNELVESGQCNVEALKGAISEEGYDNLCGLLKASIEDVFDELNPGESAIVVSHDPWVALVMEVVTGEPYNHICPELSHVIVKSKDGGHLTATANF